MQDNYRQELTDQFVATVEYLNRLMHSGRLDEWQGLDMTISLTRCESPSVCLGNGAYPSRPATNVAQTALRSVHASREPDQGQRPLFPWAESPA